MVVPQDLPVPMLLDYGLWIIFLLDIYHPGNFHLLVVISILFGLGGIHDKVLMLRDILACSSAGINVGGDACSKEEVWG